MSNGNRSNEKSFIYMYGNRFDDYRNYLHANVRFGQKHGKYFFEPFYKFTYQIIPNLLLLVRLMFLGS